MLFESFDTGEHGCAQERCRPSLWKWLQAVALLAQNFVGDQILWLWCEQRLFVRDTACQSTKWQDILEIHGTWSHYHPGYAYDYKKRMTKKQQYIAYLIFNLQPTRSSQKHKTARHCRILMKSDMMRLVVTNWFPRKQRLLVETLYTKDVERICYCGPLCQLPLSKRTAQLFSHILKRVKNKKNCSSTETHKKRSSRLLVKPECFVGRKKFFWGPHVCHLCYTPTSMLVKSSRTVFRECRLAKRVCIGLTSYS